jgi:flagellar biosynthesis protein FliQ
LDYRLVECTIILFAYDHLLQRKRVDPLSPERALDLLTSMLWSAALLAGPVMLATLLVGVIISVFQVATQIQEVTLSYVPKILTAGFVLILLGPWMVSQMVSFATDLYLLIPELGR